MAVPSGTLWPLNGSTFYMACRAIIPLMPYPDDRVDHFTFEDRERIVTLKVQFDGMRDQISDLKGLITAGTASAKQDFSSFSASIKVELTALELRIRALENFRWWIVGAAALMATIAHFILEYWGPAKPLP